MRNIRIEIYLLMVKGSKIRRYDLDHQHKKKFLSVVENVMNPDEEPVNGRTELGLFRNSFHSLSTSLLEPGHHPK